LALVPLEERLVLSATVHVGSSAAVILVPGAPKPGTSTSGFPYSIQETLLKGLPVYEQRTTTFNDHTTQVTDRLIVPNLANHTVTTTDWINLRGGAGVEKIIDVTTTVGVTKVHKITAKLPSGKTESELLVETGYGKHWTIIDGIDHLPGGMVQTIVGKSLKVGSAQLTVKIINGSNGTVQHVRSLTLSHDDTLERNRTRVISSNHVPDVTASNTTIVRLQPPSV
jgi:hypothetical protein